MCLFHRFSSNVSLYSLEKPRQGFLETSVCLPRQKHFFVTTTFGIQPNRTAYPFTNGALDILRIARPFGSVIYSQLLNYKARLAPNNNCLSTTLSVTFHPPRTSCAYCLYAPWVGLQVISLFYIFVIVRRKLTVLIYLHWPLPIFQGTEVP